MASAKASKGSAAEREDDRWNPSRSAAGAYNPWLIVALISVPTFMEVLDTSIANVALDHIAGGLSVSNDQATWVLTSYLVANAIIIPISGWLTTAIGRKRYFLLSIALFAGLRVGPKPHDTGDRPRSSGDRRRRAGPGRAIDDRRYFSA